MLFKFLTLCPTWEIIIIIIKYLRIHDFVDLFVKIFDDSLVT